MLGWMPDTKYRRYPTGALRLFYCLDIPDTRYRRYPTGARRLFYCLDSQEESQVGRRSAIVRQISLEHGPQVAMVQLPHSHGVGGPYARWPHLDARAPKRGKDARRSPLRASVNEELISVPQGV